jgi:2-polyprenyl-6-methoxyphenol hydroxylase-like FAD-dependent oxidoreductase
MNKFPEHARVVIVGGGVIGTSIAYHLAKLGWNDVVLLERDKLTSGAFLLHRCMTQRVNASTFSKDRSNLWQTVKEGTSG